MLLRVLYSDVCIGFALFLNKKYEFLFDDMEIKGVVGKFSVKDKVQTPTKAKKTIRLQSSALDDAADLSDRCRRVRFE